jgi:hypothetical protein
MAENRMKQIEQFGTKFTERRLGSRFVETRYDSTSGIVEFNIFLEPISKLPRAVDPL